MINCARAVCASVQTSEQPRTSTPRRNVDTRHVVTLPDGSHLSRPQRETIQFAEPLHSGGRNCQIPLPRRPPEARYTGGILTQSSSRTHPAGPGRHSNWSRARRGRTNVCATDATIFAQGGRRTKRPAPGIPAGQIWGRVNTMPMPLGQTANERSSAVSVIGLVIPRRLGLRREAWTAVTPGSRFSVATLLQSQRTPKTIKWTSN